MQPNTIRIIAAVVDTHNLTLYKENGDTFSIPQGDARVRPIVDTAMPLLISQGYADIIIAPEEEGGYVEFESAAKGAVRLFRIAKDKLKSLMGARSSAPAPVVMPISIGHIPANTTSAQLSAVEEVLQHAVSVSSPEFHEKDVAKQGNVVEESGETIKAHSTDGATDTIIAVVGDKVIPGVEKIKSQFVRAAKLGSTKGMENFLQRLSTVVNERQHSAEDLLKFMERGDLPIAEDGSILIYKVLNRRDRNYVDCHSGNVTQFVGAYVCMDPSLVDHNRNNECSNGLHVARRGYVRGFHGSVCVLAKVAPEDVIAVPAYDANKMRVCGYHILAELTPAQYELVKQNKPITEDPDGKILLGKALAGQHIGKTHEVRITASMGGGVQTTELDAPVKASPKTEVQAAEALVNPGEAPKDAPLNPVDVVNKVEQVSRKDMAAKLYAEGDIAALKAFKKSAKVSWEKLGIPDPDVTPPVAKPKAVAVKKDKPADTKRVVNGVELGEGSYRERIQKLLEIGITSVGVAQSILTMKKQSKKSWAILGVSEEVSKEILRLAQ